MTFEDPPGTSDYDCGWYPFTGLFLLFLRSIGKFCDIDVIYVGKETAVENNIQYGSYCYLRLHRAEATHEGKSEDDLM